MWRGQGLEFLAKGESVTCVTTMLQSDARPPWTKRSRMNCGTWVVLPQPVAPLMITTGLQSSAAMISSSNCLTGSRWRSSTIWNHSMHSSEAGGGRGGRKRVRGRKTLTDLLQVLVVLELVHQLAVQVVADLLRSALRVRGG